MPRERDERREQGTIRSMYPATTTNDSNERRPPRRFVIKKPTGGGVVAVACLVLVPFLVGLELRRSMRTTAQYQSEDTRREALRQARSPTEFMLVPPRPEYSSSAASTSSSSTNSSILDATTRIARSPPTTAGEETKDDAILLAESTSLHLQHGYQNQPEMNQRSSRFPSVDERVKLYLSNWYLPFCNPNDRVKYYHRSDQELIVRELLDDGRWFRVNSDFDGSRRGGMFDFVHVLDRTTMRATCSHRYCKDFNEFLFPALDRREQQQTARMRAGNDNREEEIVPVPVLYQFGDEEKTKAPLHSNPSERGYYPSFPVVKKIRQALTAAELAKVTTPAEEGGNCRDPTAPNVFVASRNESHHNFQPIVFKLKTRRHYSRIYQVAQADIPWNKKLDKAAFRGELTGSYPVKDTSTLDDLEKCRLLPRCWLVYTHHNSNLVDARLGLPFASLKDIPETLNGHSLYGEAMSLEEMLQHKALIMLEGNDVSSGLKWALFSNSVVLMPIPTFTSWAMEELLQPWIHYIPIEVYYNSNSTRRTDAEEKMQWVLDHDTEAQEIARAGRLWISDLVLHPAADADEVEIFDEIVRRSSAHWVHDDSIIDAAGG